MRYRAIACLLVCVAFGVSVYCQSKSQIDAAYPHISSSHIPTRPTILDKLTIRFVNRGCGWFCPVYSIEINGNGTITYVGGNFARVKGMQRRHITQDQVRQLIDKFYSLNYFVLLPQYGTCGGDGDEFEFSIEWPSVSKHVMDCDALYTGQGQKTKTEAQNLVTLKIFIEDTANVLPSDAMNSNRIVLSTENPFKTFNSYPSTLQINFEARFPVDQF